MKFYVIASYYQRYQAHYTERSELPATALCGRSFTDDGAHFIEGLEQRPLGQRVCHDCGHIRDLRETA